MLDDLRESKFATIHKTDCKNRLPKHYQSKLNLRTFQPEKKEFLRAASFKIFTYPYKKELILDLFVKLLINANSPPVSCIAYSVAFLVREFKYANLSRNIFTFYLGVGFLTLL